MRITMLGCGGSAGVPLIGCHCAVCKSENPKNRRTRVSIVVEDKNTRLLVDTSPDLREQALATGLKTVDAILISHAHADHLHGIDDIRSFNYIKNSSIDLYAEKNDLDEIKQRFGYIFRPPVPERGWFRASAVGHAIKANQVMTIGTIPVIAFKQVHGATQTLGFRFGNMAYSTDVNDFPEESFHILKGIDTWIIDCLRYDPAPSHAHLELTLEWIKRIKPRRAILTHMAHELEYETLKKELPKGVEPGYDGMVIEVK